MDLVFDQTDPQANLVGIDQEISEFSWSLSSDGCPNFTRDTLYVFQEQLNGANADSYQTDVGETIDFNVLDNDDLNSDFSFNVTVDPLWGSLLDNGNGDYTFIADDKFQGTVLFVYEVCGVLCPELCDTARVEIIIGELDDCYAYNLITANGDGVNDLLEFPCLGYQNNQTNELTIYNQWGDQVHQAAPYENDWDGTFNGQALPVGTYYYVLDLKDGQSQPVYGFLIIEQ